MTRIKRTLDDIHIFLLTHIRRLLRQCTDIFEGCGADTSVGLDYKRNEEAYSLVSHSPSSSRLHGDAEIVVDFSSVIVSPCSASSSLFPNATTALTTIKAIAPFLQMCLHDVK